MVSHISHSPAETEALGEDWGRAAWSGQVIGLCGDVGAGKTQLVKGLARGLGAAVLVHSPSFSIVNVYAGGRPSFFHLGGLSFICPWKNIARRLSRIPRPQDVTVLE